MARHWGYVAKGFPQDAKVFAFYSVSSEEVGEVSSSICNTFRVVFYPLIARQRTGWSRWNSEFFRGRKRMVRA